MTRPSPTRHACPRCPRCGYDQSGEVATWKDRCPLEGVCPECGLGFRWRDVLDPDRKAPGWFVESQRGFRALIAAFQTAVLALAPWILWRRVRLHHEPRPVRLVVCVLAIALLAYPLRVLASLTDWIGGSIRAGFGPLGVFDMIAGFSLDRRDFCRDIVWPVRGSMVFSGWDDALWLTAYPIAMGAIVLGSHQAFFHVPIDRRHATRITLHALLPLAVSFLVLDGVMRLVDAIRNQIWPGGYFFSGYDTYMSDIVWSFPTLFAFVVWWVLFWRFAMGRYLLARRAWLLPLLGAVLAYAVVFGLHAMIQWTIFRLNPPEPTFP